MSELKKFFAVALILLFLCNGVAFAEDASGLTIHFFDVGKADCILIKQGENALLLDTGYRETVDEVISKLSADFNVNKLDCLLLSHFDKDHVGGANKIVQKLSPSKIYEPVCIKQSKYVKSYRQALDACNIAPVIVENTLKFSMGELNFTLYPPKPYRGMVSNDSSVITLLEFRGQRFLFMGDALDRRMETFFAEQFSGETIDFMKLPHHGFFLTKSEIFKDIYYSAKPKIVVITDSKKYGIRKSLDFMFMLDGVQEYRLRNGAVTIFSKGCEIIVNQ